MAGERSDDRFGVTPLKLLALALALALGFTSSIRAQTVNSLSDVTITLDPTKPGTTIPSDFSGISVEMQNLIPGADGTYLFRPDNKPLVNLFKMLGIHSLRAGGASADTSRIQVPGPADLDSFFGFAKAADVKILYTLRFTMTPADDAATAKYIMDHYKGELTSFEIGSEGAYAGTYEGYKDNFSAFVTALKSPDVSPDITFSGPDMQQTNLLPWITDLPKDFPDKKVLNLLTIHAYPGGNGRAVTDSSAGRATLLSPQFLEDYQKALDTIAPAAATLPFRINETNSFFAGGAPDVSNTHAAALWALDYLHWWAFHGAAGINFHMNSSIADATMTSLYSPFWAAPDGYHAYPLAYGIKAFDLGSHGASIPVQLDNSDNVNLTAYAVIAADKSIYLTVINKENGDHPKDARIKCYLKGYEIEEYITLDANQHDPASTDSETLGNARIGNDASWSGAWMPVATELPLQHAATATILHLKPN